MVDSEDMWVESVLESSESDDYPRPVPLTPKKTQEKHKSLQPPTDSEINDGPSDGPISPLGRSSKKEEKNFRGHA